MSKQTKKKKVLGKRVNRKKADQARNRRLLKKYGITLAEYYDMLGLQGNACAICHREAKTLSLSVDHSHKYCYLKVISIKGKKGWKAYCKDLQKVSAKGRTKSEAIQRVRQQLKRLSVRGILCFSCNSGLRKYGDDPARMASASKYLYTHRERMKQWRSKKSRLKKSGR